MTQSPAPDLEPDQTTPDRPSGPAPMRVGQVIEVGVRILRRRWRPALVLALLFAGPGALLAAATGVHFGEVALETFPGLATGQVDTEITVSDADLERLFGALVPVLVANLIASVLMSIGALAFAAVVADDYHARPATLGNAVHACVRRAPSAIGFMLVTSLVIVVVMLAGLLAMSLSTIALPAASVTAGGPGVFLALVALVATVVVLAYLTMRWAPAFPAMIEEGLGVRAALRRSWFLSADNVWRIFAISLLAALVTSFGGSMLSRLIAIVLTAALGSDGIVAESFAVALGSVLLAPLTPVLIAVLYFDLRSRRDLPAASDPRF